MTLNKEMAQELLLTNVPRFNDERSYNEDELFDLNELDFSNAAIQSANLQNCDLAGVDFTEAELEGIDFTGSDLSSTIFIRANITDCNFSNANLNGANFSSSVCSSNFAEADVSGANFSDGDFSESDFGMAENMSMSKFDSYTKWPDVTNLPDDFDSEYIKDDDEYTDDLPKSEGYY